MAIKIERLFIQKNTRKTEDKHPDVLVRGIYTDVADESVFVDVGAGWKSQKGTGVNVKLSEAISIEYDETKEPKREQTNTDTSDII